VEEGEGGGHLDLDLVEGLAIVHTNNGADHLREDDHVAEMRLNAHGLLTLRHNLSTQCSA